MADKTPYLAVITRVRGDINYIAEEAYRDGYDHCEKEMKKKVEEAYQKGFEDGKAQTELGCEGCSFEGTEIYLRPCSACRNAYPNQWTAKDDKIKVGDVVETQNGKRFIVTTLDSEFAVGVCANGLGVGVDLKELHKTGRHFEIDKILKEMKGGSDK